MSFQDLFVTYSSPGPGLGFSCCLGTSFSSCELVHALASVFDVKEGSAPLENMRSEPL